MKKYLLILMVLFCSIASAQTYSRPANLSVGGVADWVNTGSFIASYTATPTNAAEIGSLYIDDTDPLFPVLYRYGSAGWAKAGGASAAAYGSLYAFENTASQSIPVGSLASEATVLSCLINAGESSVITVATDTQTIAAYAAGLGGTYRVKYSVSFTSDTDAVTWDFLPFSELSEAKEYDEIEIGHTSEYVTTGSSIVTVSGACVYGSPTSKPEFRLKVIHDQASPVFITPKYASFTVERIGD